MAVVVAPAQAVRVHRLVDARAEHRLREIKSDNDGWLVVSGSDSRMTRLTCAAGGRAEYVARREAGNRAQRFMRASSVNAFELSRATTGALSRVTEDVAG